MSFHSGSLFFNMWYIWLSFSQCFKWFKMPLFIKNSYGASIVSWEANKREASAFTQGNLNILRENGSLFIHSFQFWLSIYLFSKLWGWSNLPMTQVAEENHDVQMADFIESEFLSEQVIFFSLYCFPILENRFHHNLFNGSRLSHEHLGSFVLRWMLLRKCQSTLPSWEGLAKAMVLFIFQSLHTSPTFWATLWILIMLMSTLVSIYKSQLVPINSFVWTSWLYFSEYILLSVGPL